jgi:hypothetical protein
MQRSIAELRGCAAEHLAHYTDPHGTRAFHVYDVDGRPDELTPVDCLAPALLSVPIGYRQVVPLFRPDGPGADLRRRMQALLEGTDGTEDFLDVELDPTCPPWGLVDAAVVAAGGVKGLKAVAVTKILHRKRPALVPIFDKAVYTFYMGTAPPNGAYQNTPRRFWPVLRDDLRNNRPWVTALAATVTTADGRPLGVLRAADMIVWEHEVTSCTG